MACTCGCDNACGCCGQAGSGAGEPDADDLRAKVTRLEAELADLKTAGS